MSSLLLLMLDEKVQLPHNPDPYAREKFNDITRTIITALRQTKHFAVNISTVLQDLLSVGEETIIPETGAVRGVILDCNWQQFSRVMPPYPCMWLEGNSILGKTAFLVWRVAMKIPGNVAALLEQIEEIGTSSKVIHHILEKNATTVCAEECKMIISHLYCERNGMAYGPLGQLAILVGSDGRHIDSRYGAFTLMINEDQTRQNLNSLMFILCHCLLRMNCANTSLQPTEPARTHRRPQRKEPRVVWHEIKIDSVPKISREKKEKDNSDSECSEIRSHWVRGHYADYTKGKGLFGRAELKKVFWMPEHQRGSEEVGKVVADYTIVGKDQSHSNGTEAVREAE